VVVTNQIEVVKKGVAESVVKEGTDRFIGRECCNLVFVICASVSY